jgi:tRNA A-37 threonylcarbamoyl transferase component Bud32
VKHLHIVLQDRKYRCTTNTTSEEYDDKVKNAYAKEDEVHYGVRFVKALGWSSSATVHVIEYAPNEADADAEHWAFKFGDVDRIQAERDKLKMLDALDELDEGAKKRTQNVKLVRLVRENDDECRTTSLKQLNELRDQYYGAIVLEPVGRPLLEECMCTEDDRNRIVRVVKRDVTHTLEWLHANGYAHMDVAPSNIVLTGFGDELEAYLIDAESITKLGAKAVSPLQKAFVKLAKDHLAHKRCDIEALQLVLEYIKSGSTTQTKTEGTTK